MQVYLSVIFLLLLNSIVLADESLLEFNSENLTKIALKNSSNEVLNEYAFHILKTQKTSEYFKYRKDKKKIAELIKEERRLLDESLKTIPTKAKLIYKINTNYHSFDPKTSVINIGNKFAGKKQSIFRANDKIKGLPNYFLLLIPNLEIQNSIKIIKKNYERRQKYLRKISQINNKNVYIEYILSLEKYQNQHSFQTVIDKISIYTSKNKKSLLGSKVETRNHKKLINNWLLSDGITNPLVGIHAFHFSNNRLQDQLSSNSQMAMFCKKTKKIGIHQVVICKKHFSQNTDLIINYLGGKIAQIDLIAIGKISSSETHIIQSKIKKFLKLPSLNLQYSAVTWNDFNVDFILYSDAFLNKTSSRTDYKNIFESNDLSKERTLILSMMADRTRKLLTDLGVKL